MLWRVVRDGKCGEDAQNECRQGRVDNRTKHSTTAWMHDIVPSGPSRQEKYNVYTILYQSIYIPNPHLVSKTRAKPGSFQSIHLQRNGV